MRRQRPLRASSTQELCIFCTFRLFPDGISRTSNRAITPQRRYINSSQRSAQFAGPAASSSNENGQRINSPAPQGFQFGQLYKPPPEAPTVVKRPTTGEPIEVKAPLINLGSNFKPRVDPARRPVQQPGYVRREPPLPWESGSSNANSRSSALNGPPRTNWAVPTAHSASRIGRLDGSTQSTPTRQGDRYPPPAANASSWTQKEPVTRPYAPMSGRNGHQRRQENDDRNHNGRQSSFKLQFMKPNVMERSDQTNRQADPSQWPQLQRARRDELQEDGPRRNLVNRVVQRAPHRPPFDQLDPEQIANRGYMPFATRVRTPTCYYCQREGHEARDCPERRGDAMKVQEKFNRPPEAVKAQPAQVSSDWRDPFEDDPAYANIETARRSNHRQSNSVSAAADIGVGRGTDGSQFTIRRHQSQHPRDAETELKIHGLANVADTNADARRRKPRRREYEEEDDEEGLGITSKKTKGREKAKGRSTRRDEDDEDDEGYEKAERHRQRKAERQKGLDKALRPRVKAPKVRSIQLPEFINVNHLAQELGLRLEDFMPKLRDLGFTDINNDHVLNAENAGLVAMEFGFEVTHETRDESKDILALPLPDDMSSLPQRPPVVTIMGHVDHGKTTLLDFLRKSSIAASEHGGITQHIGAFRVPMSSGKTITFLDTPGHAAFLAMRQRGANVTDIVILVVAADDSVMPQTIEAIKHARAANVPMIVAVNKVDKEDARPEMVKQDLARHGVEVEDFGGDTQAVAVSGKTGLGMKELEEAIAAQTELLDPRAPSDGPVEGWVLEAATKKAGKVATVLIRRGTLRLGDIIVAGTTFARVRSLRDEAGVLITEAGPGVPVEVEGWKGPPGAGDELLQAPHEQKAAAVADYRQAIADQVGLAKDVEAINEARKLEQEKREREEALAKAQAESKDGDAVPEEIPVQEKESGLKEIFFVVKADVAGSVEAVINSISHLGNNEVRPHILRSGVGAVSEFDIDHAAAANGHIISFNTLVEPRMLMQAEKVGVEIIDHSIIYRLVEDVTTKLEEQLAPLVTQRVVGEAEISQQFMITVKGRQKIPIAGCKVRNGVVNRNGKIRVLRLGHVVWDGSLHSLKNAKKDVMETRKGTECGMGFEGWTDFEVGDQVQCYEEHSEKRTL